MVWELRACFAASRALCSAAAAAEAACSHYASLERNRKNEDEKGERGWGGHEVHLSSHVGLLTTPPHDLLTHILEGGGSVPCPQVMPADIFALHSSSVCPLASFKYGKCSQDKS
jgi:hypothetical protein